MRKFYFLNNKKKWTGPFWFIQILIFTLKSVIKPDTYLWHNKLSKDFCQHPMMSIYARKKSKEYRCLPQWVFGTNLKIMILNVFYCFKKRLKKKDSWETVNEKPIEIIKNKEIVPKTYLIPSITAIHDFAAPSEFTVQLSYEEYNDETTIKTTEYSVKLSDDGNPGIMFEITMSEPPSVGGVKFKESYGLHRQLILKNENERISVAKNNVFDFSTRFPYKPQILKGRFSQANLIVRSGYKNSYNRLLIQVIDDEIIIPQHLLGSTGSHLYDYDLFNIHQSLMGISFKNSSRFTEIVIDEKRYHIYCVDESIYLIDGIDREDLDIFKQNAEVIRITLAILCGKFYGGSCYYVTSDNPNFENVEGIWYEIERSSVISNRRIIDLQLFRSSFKEKGEEYEARYKSINRPVDPKLFACLCNKLLTIENLRHAAELVISAMGNSDPVQQGALYSVALETLTKQLRNERSNDLKPIDDKNLADSLIEDILTVLSNYENKISKTGFEILVKKIINLNNPTNQDNLVKTFELYDIILTDEDVEAIKNRNKYLHGSSPLDRKFNFELMLISLKLHTLIVALLLKSVGYSGHIINLDIQAYFNVEDKIIEFVKEQKEIVIKHLGILNSAMDNHDEATYNAAKNEIENYLRDNKLSNLFRII
jgi:hypothetical protein